MRLRRVTRADVDAYTAMRCDPAMMAELGGPQSPDRMPALVERDVAAVAAGERWIYMILADDDQVAGMVTLYKHNGVSEIGWMVLPPFQGRGLAKAAAREVLIRAAATDQWGDVHAWPSASNAASNAVCRSLGLRYLGEEEITFGGKRIRANHWTSARHSRGTNAPGTKPFPAVEVTGAGVGDTVSRTPRSLW
jgi:RimJ/RimL family protein N-acetyltransferase